MRSDPRQAIVLLGHTGDIHALIAHALEGGVELEEDAHLPQIGAERLKSGHQSRPHLMNLEIGLVDVCVDGDHPIGQLHVPGGDRIHGHLDHVLGAVDHAEDGVLQSFQLLVEMKIGV